ncbi:MAG TPA: flavin reductase family protein [Bacteroidetes bacterium]|nr:flavin reductase family protein [Bacteroidota bacterium]
MQKVTWKPGTMLYPLPAVMVSCGAEPEEYNIVTVAWTGIVNTGPPMCYISLRKSRHSHGLISKTGEFVINLTTRELAFATDWCGVKSGRDVDKFKEMKLHPVAADKVKAPLIAESPVNLECVVKQVIELGTHDMFLADIVAVHGDKKYLDPETGAFDLARAQPIAYSHGKYYALGSFIGKFGFSVRKKKKKKAKGRPKKR